MQTSHGDSATLRLLPNELVAEIIERIGASDPFGAAGLCDVNPQMRAWCQVPLFDATVLPPTIQRNLDAPPVSESGLRKISIAEAVRARMRRDTMRRCVLYALYSLYAYMGQAGQGPVGLPVLPFDPSKTDDDWAALLFSMLEDDENGEQFDTVYITLPELAVQLGEEYSLINGELVLEPPSEQHYAAVNRVLTQALVRSVIDTGSEADTPSLCASVDVQRAFLDDADLPNEHFITSGNAAVALDVGRIAHLWYPWVDNQNTFESTVRGEPVYVYDNRTLA